MGKRKMDSDLHRIKLEAGTVYQTSKNGTYYYRYQVQKARKCISLGTSNQEEAIRKAKDLLPTVKANNLEVIATHVKVARKFAAKTRSVPLSRIWEIYTEHPARAMPATVHEQLAYQSTLAEFLRFLGDKVLLFSQITDTHAMQFSDYLRTTQISVETHNRKIKRLRKIFATLQVNPRFSASCFSCSVSSCQRSQIRCACSSSSSSISILAIAGQSDFSAFLHFTSRYAI